ncbi:hypothetical protein ERX37_04535 [Macrococcus hajekii]|uniref:Uncharacterized protein n=1 Tax=Macrococcus hajekii TaxID=198482 RepID=A0A4R6BNK5_9STAP|nr:hypothetical protein [Macrococcus hajekii]TDM03358.1 hypothetical protein ERX37_04535 [Macrococcus hajekii]GGA98188.1 hypothetical protein GCM10007190_02750 [Macrococcus hajekii]
MKIDDINKYFINNTIKVEPNHIQLITHCNEYHKLSVVGVTQKDKYNSNTYFGLHPILSPSLLQTFFINNAITDSSRFWGQIQEIHNANKDIKLCNFFDNKLRKIEFAFIGRAILRIAEHFSINLLISGTENELLALIDKINNLKNASKLL